MTDESNLLARLRDGDEAAFAGLVELHHASLVRLARHYVASEAVAEEVAQEAWLGLLRGLDAFEGRSSIKTWLFRILVNRAISRGVREGRTIPFSSLLRADDDAEAYDDRFTAEGAWSTPPRPFQLPERRVALLELRAELRSALARLPLAQQIVVTLRDVEGFSSEDIAELLELSTNNVRVLLHRGRNRLQATLSGAVDEP